MRTLIYFKKYIKGDLLQGKKEIDFYANGDKYWTLNGDCHRKDGPAVQFSSGEEYWFLNGKEYPCEKEYWEAMEEYKKNKNR